MRGVVLGGAFIILWWMALLIVLPIGAHAAGEDSAPGTDPGAPHKPGLLLKAGIATAAAIVLWAIFYGLVLSGVIDI